MTSDRPWLMLASAGILLGLGLILGVLIERGASRAPERQAPLEGGVEGTETALVLEGRAPDRVAVGVPFEVTCRVLSVGGGAVDTVRLVVESAAAWDAGDAREVRIGETVTLTLTPNDAATGPLGLRAEAAHAVTGLRFPVALGDAEGAATAQPGAGRQVRVRMTTFAPERVPVGRPFRVVAVVENDGDVPLEAALSLRPGPGLAPGGALEDPSGALAPGAARMLPGTFRATRPGRMEVRAVGGGPDARGTSLAIVVAE